MPEILPRRRVLLASAAALPVLLATAGCQSSDLFTGPDPLAGRPPLAADVVTLQAVIAAEETLISLYRAALAGESPAAAGSPLVRLLLGQHEQHLAQLRARLILPPGTATGTGPTAGTGGGQASAAAGTGRGQASSPASSGSPPVRPPRVTLAQLRAAEQASAARLVRRLATVPPALAQLFASIAASDATHVTALGG